MRGKERYTSLNSAGFYRRTRAPEHNVYTYTLKETLKNDTYLRADRPKEIKQLTLCVWVYFDSSSSSGATVVLFGTKLEVKIYLREDFTFGVSFLDWNRYVQFGKCQDFGHHNITNC